MNTENENWEAESGDNEGAPEGAPEGGREVVVRPQGKAQLVANERGYIAPTTVEEAARMAQAVIHGNLAPSSYNNDAGKIMLGIMSALEAGLPPLYGLRQIAIIQNRPVIWGDAAVALVQSKGIVASYNEEKIGEPPPRRLLVKGKDGDPDTTIEVPMAAWPLHEWPDDFGFRVTMRRKGQEGEYSAEFTVGMAKNAKLWLNAKKVPWMEHPQRMLKIRARSWALRDGFSDALAGLAIREEVEDTFGPEDRHVVMDLTAEPIAEVPPMPGASEVTDEAPADNG